MTVTAQYEQWGPFSVRFTVSSSLGGTPTFYWYEDGVLVEASTRNWRQLDLLHGAGVGIDVFDDSGDSPTPGFPARVTLQWHPSADGTATKYRVEFYSGGAWSTLATLYDNGRSILRWTSEVLDDDMEYTLGIVPVNASGNDGDRRTLIFRMRRRPDAPDVSYSYDGVSGNLTVSAA